MLAKRCHEIGDGRSYCSTNITLRVRAILEICACVPLQRFRHQASREDPTRGSGVGKKKRGLEDFLAESINIWGFLKGGYPKSSSISRWVFPLQTIHLGLPPFQPGAQCLRVHPGAASQQAGPGPKVGHGGGLAIAWPG